MNTEIKKNHSLGESVDLLREDVVGLAGDIKELYELDEDNYQMIKNLQKALDISNNKINALQKAVRSHRAKTVFGFLCVGIGTWILFELICNELEKIRKQVDELKNGKDTEESDG